ncbi:MAG: hypothetical protein Q7R43_04960 [Candidatus Daviesbacteria bacterium]|nr:hypothetical protein [Candidatus Daviesbacteria bacterium]
MKLPKKIIENKVTIILVLAAILVLGGGFLLFQRFSSSNMEAPVEEVDISFDSLGPYALLFPRRDGNALVLNIKRTGSYDQIKYELSYNSEGIDRGAQGEINTKEKKGEYEQEILFGSCSTGGKCVFDKGVENGTLTLHIRKGKEAYRVITQWHLQKPDVALGVLTSGDNHFSYNIDPKSADLSLTMFSITNDLSGIPKLPEGKQVLGKVYSVNSPVAKALPEGKATVEMADNIPADAKIARFDEGKNSWDLTDTKIEGSKASSKVSSGGIFAVLIPLKK